MSNCAKQWRENSKVSYFDFTLIFLTDDFKQIEIKKKQLCVYFVQAFTL